MHADTFVFPPVRDDEHAHANSSSDESSDSEESNDSDSDSESVQSDAELENPYVVVEPKKSPKWAQTTLQDAGDLIGDPTNTRRTQSDF